MHSYKTIYPAEACTKNDRAHVKQGKTTKYSSDIENSGRMVVVA